MREQITHSMFDHSGVIAFIEEITVENRLLQIKVQPSFVNARALKENPVY